MFLAAVSPGVTTATIHRRLCVHIGRMSHIVSSSGRAPGQSREEQRRIANECCQKQWKCDGQPTSAAGHRALVAECIVVSVMSRLQPKHLSAVASAWADRVTASVGRCFTAVQHDRFTGTLDDTARAAGASGCLTDVLPPGLVTLIANCARHLYSQCNSHPLVTRSTGRMSLPAAAVPVIRGG